MQDTDTSSAFAISSDGSATALDKLPAPNAAPEAAYVWTHLSIGQEGARAWLNDEAMLDSAVVIAMMAEEARPRVVIKDDGVMVILRAINLNEGEPPEEMISLRMWIDEHRVITTRRRNIKAISEIQKSLVKGEAPASPAEFLHWITSRVFARMEPFFEDLEDRIAEEEERIASGAGKDLGEGMFTIRKQVAIYRRYVTPQKLVLMRLHNQSIPGLGAELQEHLGEELDRVTRFVEELEELAARTQILNEEVRNIRAERLNKLTYVFSIVATVFLPLGFLTGLMGVNVGGMPGLESVNAFWILAALCVLVVGVLISVFKMLKVF